MSSSQTFRRTMPNWVVIWWFYNAVIDEGENLMFLSPGGAVGPGWAKTAWPPRKTHQPRSRLRGDWFFQSAVQQRSTSQSRQRYHAKESGWSGLKMWVVRNNRACHKMWTVCQKSLLLHMRWHVSSSSQEAKSLAKGKQQGLEAQNFYLIYLDLVSRHTQRVELGNVRPPLPPKMSTQPQAPVPPPRRNRKSCLSSPMPERRDQVCEVS